MAGRAEIARENGKKGGRPPGSKSKHTLEKEAARELVRNIVTAHLEPIVMAQVAQALGIKYLVVRNKKTGQFVRVGQGAAARALKSDEEIIEVWEKDPSSAAAADLLNRAIDKPKEQVQELKVDGDWEKLAARLAKVRGTAGKA